MICPKCRNEQREDGTCSCGFQTFSAPMTLLSPISTEQTSFLTDVFRKSWICGKEGHTYPKRKSNMWGPSRPTYTNESPAHFAVFNSITNNTALGDERDFVRICEKNKGETYRGNIRVEPGKQYEVFIYFHNNASATFNDKEHQYRGAARDVRLSCLFPLALKKGQEGIVQGKISASNTNPRKVWAGAYITASEDMTLHYVTGSAKIYNRWKANGRVLSTNLFSDMGTFIGLNDLNGVIPGCDIYAGQVVFTIQTKPKATIKR